MSIISVHPFNDENLEEVLAKFETQVGEKITRDRDTHQLSNGTLYQIVEIV